MYDKYCFYTNKITFFTKILDQWMELLTANMFTEIFLFAHPYKTNMHLHVY